MIEMDDLSKPITTTNNNNITTDSEIGSRHPGLTCNDASMRLSVAARSALDRVNDQVPSYVPRWRTFLFRVDLAIVIVHIVILFMSNFLVSESISSSGTPSEFTEHVAEITVLIFLVFWNAALFYEQVEAPARQVYNRAQSAVKMLERMAPNTAYESKIPSLPSAPMIKVIRDGIIRSLPSVLLVKGDVIELHFGDIAPATCSYVYVTKPPGFSVRPEYVLESGQGFRPSLFPVPPSTLMQLEGQLNQGKYQFQLLDTPIEKVLDGLATSRPTPVMTNQLFRLQTALHRFLICIYLLSVIISLVRYFVLGHATPLQALLWVHNVTISLIPLTIPTLYLLFRSFSNAHIAVLWQELQISKTDYEDVDQDEFDFDAPPPTKNVTLAKFDVLAKALQINTSDLTESLGSITVLCFVDREGTLCEAFPSVDQIWLPTTVLDVGLSANGQYMFEDRDWRDHLPLLCPLGFTWLMLTHCDSGKPSPHRNLCGLHTVSHTKASRQTCLCPLAREIGQINPPKQYAPVNEIFSFAPYHPSLADQPQEATIAVSSSALASNQMSLTALLALHRNGAATPLSDPASSASIEYDPYHAPADLSGLNVLRNLADDEFEVPFLHSILLYDAVSQHHQLVSAGSVEMILDICTDAWLGDNTLAPLTNEQEMALIEWYCNSTMNDHQVLAFAYRPVIHNPGSCLTKHESFIYHELPFSPQPIQSAYHLNCATTAHPHLTLTASNLQFAETINGPGSPTLAVSGSVQIKSNEPEHLFTHLSATQKNSGSSSGANSEICALTHNQIFLGMTAFTHEPKEDVCDVVEDVALAGIRFVYFSPTNERQTKAFGERLGLDTDWNSCILLSQSSDPHASPMYLERTDIKARLPRGLEAIRQHLLEVDDIPLHVSLFAESSPRTVAGMARILQEHGEVVCAMGSTLNSANAEIFFSVDLAVGIEPVSIKSAAPHSCNIPPLALGSKLISLPCQLVMHPETSLYAFTQLLKTARQLCRAARQAFTLIVATSLMLSITQFLILLSMLPPWRSWIAMVTVWLLIPMLAVTYASNPHEVDTMKEFTERNLDHVRDLNRFMRYFACRFAIPITLSVWVYLVALVTTLPDSVPWTSIFGTEMSSLEAEIVALMSLVLFVLTSSITMLHRTQPFWEYQPFRNRPFCGMLFILLFLSVSIPFFVAKSVIARLPWYFFLVVFGSLPIQLQVHEKAKSWDRRQLLRFQKRSKLEFNTRLGMHSPI